MVLKSICAKGNICTMICRFYGLSKSTICLQHFLTGILCHKWQNINFEKALHEQFGADKEVPGLYYIPLSVMSLITDHRQKLISSMDYLTMISCMIKIHIALCSTYWRRYSMICKFDLECHRWPWTNGHRSKQMSPVDSLTMISFMMVLHLYRQ